MKQIPSHKQKNSKHIKERAFAQFSEGEEMCIMCRNSKPCSIHGLETVSEKKEFEPVLKNSKVIHTIPELMTVGTLQMLSADNTSYIGVGKYGDKDAIVHGEKIYPLEGKLTSCLSISPSGKNILYTTRGLSEDNNETVYFNGEEIASFEYIESANVFDDGVQFFVKGGTKDDNTCLMGSEKVHPMYCAISNDGTRYAYLKKEGDK